MSFPRLLIFCFIVTGINSYSQGVYVRVMTGFSNLAGGKTEWIDLDNDNDLDLLFSGSDGSTDLTIVYENVSGTFSVRSTNLPVLSGFASADYDKDGDIDLLCFNRNTPFTKLYRNDGGFMFSESASIGEFSPNSATWLDIDNDEDLDLFFIGNILVPRLFENTATGFVEVTNTIFPECANCNSDVADINGDGKVDIILTGGVTSLYLNAGNKEFTPDAAANFKQLSMGDVACGDFDGDGDFDILLTGAFNGSPYTGVYENKNSFLVERTDLGLIPVITNSASGLLWYNVNNDGNLDLFLSGKTIPGNVFSDNAKVFKNNGGSFVDIQDGYLGVDGFSGSYDAGDFDNDGDIDIAFQGTHAVLEGFPLPSPVIKRYSGFYKHWENQNAYVSNTKPLPPGNVDTFEEKVYRKEIRLKWNAGADAETPVGGLFYNFYLRDETKKLVVPNVDFSNGNILTTNAPNGTGKSGFAFDMPEGNLYYAVQSVDGAKRGSVFSDEKMFYHFNGPEAVKAEIVDQQNVNLSWLDHSSLETNFEISRSTSPVSGFTSLSILPANTESFADNFTFDTETEYYYQIRGYNSQISVYDSLVLVIPNRATNLTAQALNASSIKLVWDDQSLYEIAYIIERRQGVDEFAAIATLDPNITQFEDTQQLKDGTTYEYRVVAQGKNGALAPISSATATTNARPSGVDFEVSADEDKILKLTANDFNIHFLDDDVLDHLTKIKIVSLPDNGTLYVNDSEAAIDQEITSDLFDYIEFRPWPDYAGVVTFEVLAFDGIDYSEMNWIISLSINQVNDPPVFSLASTKTLDEDFVGRERINVGRGYFPGEENQIITYSISPQTSDIVNVSFNPTSGQISLVANKDKFGEIEFTVTADDGQAQDNTYFQKIKVTIRPVNDLPIFEPIADQQADSISITINLDVKDPDNNTTPDMFSAVSSNTAIVKKEKITFAASGQGKVMMAIVSEGRPGETTIYLELDDWNLYVYQQFNLTVLQSAVTGLNDDAIGSIVIFPNPVLDYLQIQVSKELATSTFFLKDTQGRILQSGSIESLMSKIDFRGMSTGVYILGIIGDQGFTTLRKIVKR